MHISEERDRGRKRGRCRDTLSVIQLTPSQAEETFPNEPGPNFPCHSHIGLPSFCQNPAEGRQEKEVQKCSCHRAYALSIQQKKRERGERLIKYFETFKSSPNEGFGLSIRYHSDCARLQVKRTKIHSLIFIKITRNVNSLKPPRLKKIVRCKKIDPSMLLLPLIFTQNNKVTETRIDHHLGLDTLMVCTVLTMWSFGYDLDEKKNHFICRK